MHDCYTTFFLSNFYCSKMPILWASCTMGFLRCPDFRKIFFLNLHKCTYLVSWLVSVSGSPSHLTKLTASPAQLLVGQLTRLPFHSGYATALDRNFTSRVTS